MDQNFKTISETYTGLVVEKKSRFIATLAPVKTQEEALDFIKAMKKKYFDARHNCSAYIIGASDQIVHSSDDGEPSGTAGKPILTVLTGKGLYNVVCVVTRYFGGTLLGTGGLVRAYTAAAEDAVNNAVLKQMVYASHMTIDISYNDLGKIQYILSQNEAAILSTDYSDAVSFNILIPVDKEDALTRAITEATQSKAVVTLIERNHFEL